MVSRASPFEASYRAYHSGGTRSVIEKADDSKLMQEHSGNFSKGESRKGVESPQNYGFTSVVADATKDKNGKIDMGAESFVSFQGGNRSFPVYGAVDDRRHRLKGLGDDAAKGSSAMYGLKEWGQQYLNTEDGQFITGNKEKKNRMQLVENQNGKKQPANQGTRSPSTKTVAAMRSDVTPHPVSRNGNGMLVFRTRSGVEFEIEEFGEVSTFADGGGSGGGAGGGGQQQQSQANKPTGQKTLHKEETDIALEQNGKETFSQHGQYYSSVRGGSDGSMYYDNRKKSAQTTQDHVHVRFEDNRIWVDMDGHWSESPIQQKKDRHCKD